MNTPIEHQLRELFADDANGAPGTAGLLEGATRKVHHARQVRAWTYALGITALGTAMALGVATPWQATPIAPTSGLAGKPLAGAPSASCVMTYSPARVATLAFSFDGTVTGIGPATTNRPGSGRLFGLVAVTFAVHEWFRGGSANAVTVDMPAPEHMTTQHAAPSRATYRVGTRLLVSGQPRWGGAPLNDPIAWTGCGGFTRYYSPQVAAEWRNATK